MKTLKAWLLGPAKWYQFWMPQSGPIGGVIGAAVIITALLILSGCLTDTVSDPIKSTCQSGEWGDTLRACGDTATADTGAFGSPNVGGGG